jgi:hypothetical protein
VEVQLQYRGLDVTVTPPKGGIEGRYTIAIGDLVTAHPTVKRRKLLPGKKIRVTWDKDYGRRFNNLLQGALRQFFKEIEAI